MTVELEQTCGACPEQYVARIDGQNVGFLHLRHGSFTVDVKGKQVYCGFPKGDGMFESDEREYYLTIAKAAILEHLTDSETKMEKAERRLREAEEKFNN